METVARWLSLQATADLLSYRHLGCFVSNRGGRFCSASQAYRRIIHEKTYVPEPCEYLFINHGPLQYLDAEGNTVLVLDWMGIQAKWDDAAVVE
jgi:hypothetical protein